MSIWKGTFFSNRHDEIHGDITIYIPKHKKQRYTAKTTVEFMYKGNYNSQKKIIYPITAFYSSKDKQYTRFEPTTVLLENNIVIVLEIITKNNIYGNYRSSDLNDSGEITFSNKKKLNGSSCVII